MLTTICVISASKRLFENYVDYLGSDVSWPDLEKDLLLTLGRSKRGDQHYRLEDRLERYSQMAKWLPHYNEDDWFNKAIEQEVRGLEDSQDGILAKFTIFKDQY